MAAFKEGDSVRMINPDPMYSLGKVEVGDVGVITEVGTGDGFVGDGEFRVDFPSQSHWLATLDDIEHSDKVPVLTHVWRQFFIDEAKAAEETLPEASLDEAVANWQNVNQQIKELQAQAVSYERVMRQAGIKPI